MEDWSKLPEGDVLVMRHPGAISDELAARIRHDLESRFPGKKVIVLGDGMSIESMPMPGQIDRIEQKLDALRMPPSDDQIDALLLNLNAAGGFPIDVDRLPQLREVVRNWLRCASES